MPAEMRELAVHILESKAGDLSPKGSRTSTRTRSSNSSAPNGRACRGQGEAAPRAGSRRQHHGCLATLDRTGKTQADAANTCAGTAGKSTGAHCRPDRASAADPGEESRGSRGEADGRQQNPIARKPGEPRGTRISAAPTQRRPCATANSNERPSVLAQNVSTDAALTVIRQVQIAGYHRHASSCAGRCIRNTWVRPQRVSLQDRGMWVALAASRLRRSSSTPLAPHRGSADQAAIYLDLSPMVSAIRYCLGQSSMCTSWNGYSFAQHEQYRDRGVCKRYFRRCRAHFG